MLAVKAAAQSNPTFESRATWPPHIQFFPITSSGSNNGLSSQDQTARRVCVQGRVHRVAKQGGLIFVTLRRGLNKMQCLLSGQLANTYGAIMLARETSLEISGELWSVPAGVRVPLDRELHADYHILAHDSRFS